MAHLTRGNIANNLRNGEEMEMAVIGIFSMLILLWLGFALFFGQKSIAQALQFIGALMVFLIVSPFIYDLLQAALPKLLLLGGAVVGIVGGVRMLFSFKH